MTLNPMKLGGWIAALLVAVAITLASRGEPVPTNVPPHVVDVSPVRLSAPLTTSGPIFLRDGQPWRWKGVSAFGQLDRFARGEDISGFLSDFKGYNLLRVWPYVTWRAKDGTLIGWEPPAPDVVLAFLNRVAQDGFSVEITLLTDDDPARIDPARRLVERLQAARPPNVVFEIGNEPRTHKAIDTRALKATLDASGFLYSSGDYEESNRWFGSFLTVHTPRDREWPRKVHDLYEYFHGGGPSSPADPPHRVPVVADEPAKPSDVSGDREKDFLAYFAASSLLGAGATFHFESGKYSHHKTVGDRVEPADGRPSDDERRFAAIALTGMDAFPAAAPRGNYRRLVERSLETYAVGPYMVRVRPQTRDAPEPGWTAIGDAGVMWRKQ
jgi:hypothetical protein